jgi:hypothetical protein
MKVSRDLSSHDLSNFPAHGYLNFSGKESTPLDWQFSVIEISRICLRSRHEKRDGRAIPAHDLIA